VISPGIHRDVSQRSPAFMAGLIAVLFLVFKQDIYFVIPAYGLSKLYVNNLLLIFNSRLRIGRSRSVRPCEDPSFVSFATPSTSFALANSKISHNVQTDQKFCQQCRRLMPGEKLIDED
jgi:hypothetical protein